MSLTKNIHKSLSQIESEINTAIKYVKIKGIYVHFKDTDSRLIVIGFGTTENNDELCVLYKRIDNDKVTFIRPLKSWLEKIEIDGKLIERFKLIN